MKIDLLIVIFFLFTSLSIASHAFYFPHSMFRDMGIFLTSLSILFFITNQGPKFLKSYIKIIFALTLISIPFWVSYNFLILLFDLDNVIANLSKLSFYYNEDQDAFIQDNNRYNFLLFFNFTSNPSLFYRNFGYMWEPGQFAAYLGYGLLFLDMLRFKFNYNLNKSFYNIFYIGLLTTFSTAGYLICFLHIIISIISESISISKGRITNKIYLTIFFTIFFIFFSLNVDFIYGKFLRQFTSDITNYNYYNGRLNFFLMFNEIMQSPLFGSGTFANISVEMFAAMSAEFINGYVDFARSWGIILFLLMNILVLKTFNYIFQNKFITIMYFFFFILINSSQNLFTQFLPFVVMFFYNFKFFNNNR
tara:strand:- start:2866 stop:3954 length:1089 start_codon:yes stop_codon:yes gene_type:complete